MSHFTDETWFDYVRNLLPPDQMQAMKTHLDERCGDCTELYHLWKRVLNNVTRESCYTAPASDVTSVTAAFERHQRSTVPGTSLVATLLFDSLYDPAPAGFRSVLPHARHLLYQADSWTIALRLKTQPANQVTLVGHVTNTGPSCGTEASEFEISISRGDTLIAQTTANNLGEFHLEYQNLSALRLRLRLSEEHSLDVDLPAPEH